jgi:hypothetical protein
MTTAAANSRQWSLKERERLAAPARAGRTGDLLAALAGASPSVLDGKGDGLLMLAAYHSHRDTVGALAASGASALDHATVMGADATAAPLRPRAAQPSPPLDSARHRSPRDGSPGRPVARCLRPPQQTTSCTGGQQTPYFARLFITI